MKKALQFIFLILFLFPAFKAFSQDTIVKIDGEKIQAKVLKVTESKVEYQRFGFADGPFYTLRKGDISEIKYSNGMVDLFDEQLIKRDKAKKDTSIIKLKRAFKIECFSPIRGDLAIAYEQSVFYETNIELKLGVIKGQNVNEGMESPVCKGAFLKAGLKFVPTQSYSTFSGFYLKPELLFSNYTSQSFFEINYSPITETTIKSSTFGGDLIVGYECINLKHILFDTYLGWGFAYTNNVYGNSLANNQNILDGINSFGFINVYNSRPSSIFTLGILLGYVFK